MLLISSGPCRNQPTLIGVLYEHVFSHLTGLVGVLRVCPAPATHSWKHFVELVTPLARPLIKSGFSTVFLIAVVIFINADASGSSVLVRAVGAPDDDNGGYLFWVPFANEFVNLDLLSHRQRELLLVDVVVLLLLVVLVVVLLLLLLVVVVVNCLRCFDDLVVALFVELVILVSLVAVVTNSGISRNRPGDVCYKVLIGQLAFVSGQPRSKFRGPSPPLQLSSDSPTTLASRLLWLVQIKGVFMLLLRTCVPRSGGPNACWLPSLPSACFALSGVTPTPVAVVTFGATAKSSCPSTPSWSPSCSSFTSWISCGFAQRVLPWCMGRYRVVPASLHRHLVLPERRHHLLRRHALPCRLDQRALP